MHNDSNLAIFPLAVMPAVEKMPRLYTLAEYLRKEERTSDLHEYENGIISKHPMALGPHNIISGNILAALKFATKPKTQKYVVFSNQQLVYLPKLNVARYPDVLVVVERPEYWQGNEALLINPILIVEVLSKSTAKYDRTLKFEEYKTADSFTEYLLIDQKKCHIEQRFREEPNLWRDSLVSDISGEIYLKSLDCTLQLLDIYEDIVFVR